MSLIPAFPQDVSFQVFSEILNKGNEKEQGDKITEFAKKIIECSLVSKEWKGFFRKTYLESKYDYLFFKTEKSKCEFPLINELDPYFSIIEGSPLLFKIFAMVRECKNIDDLQEICQLIPEAATAIHKACIGLDKKQSQTNISMLQFACISYKNSMSNDKEFPLEAIKILFQNGGQRQDVIVKVIDYLLNFANNISQLWQYPHHRVAVMDKTHIVQELLQVKRTVDLLDEVLIGNLSLNEVIELPIYFKSELFEGVSLNKLREKVSHLSLALNNELDLLGLKKENLIEALVRERIRKAIKMSAALLILMFLIKGFDILSSINYGRALLRASSNSVPLKTIKIGDVCLSMYQETKGFILRVTQNGIKKNEMLLSSEESFQELMHANEAGPDHLIQLLQTWGETASEIAQLIKLQLLDQNNRHFK